jgi:hypothetical protein
MVAPAVHQAPTDKGFLVLFFKKELLSLLTLRFAIQQSRACAFPCCTAINRGIGQKNLQRVATKSAASSARDPFLPATCEAYLTPSAWQDRKNTNVFN